ncbi:MAG: glutathione S-transferase N-terminal domain-containing protein [Hyphomicrobiaceae bacterium]
MAIQLFDLTDADEKIFFSPYCWRTRMALKHKGLAFESLPWHFTETDRLTASGGQRVPVIIDGDTCMGESADIAAYLDEAYPNAPALLADDAARARARFIESWCRAAVFPRMVPLAVFSVFKIIAEKDKAYFRESRERMLKTRLEDLSKDPAAEANALNKALGPANDALTAAPFLAGAAPDYSDCVLFGTVMWPYMVCSNNPIDMASPVGKWLDRMLDLHDGYARRSPTARSA